jgi:hypothetical protein
LYWKMVFLLYRESCGLSLCRFSCAASHQLTVLPGLGACLRFLCWHRVPSSWVLVSGFSHRKKASCAFRRFSLLPCWLPLECGFISQHEEIQVANKFVNCIVTIRPDECYLASLSRSENRAECRTAFIAVSDQEMRSWRRRMSRMQPLSCAAWQMPLLQLCPVKRRRVYQNQQPLAVSSSISISASVLGSEIHVNRGYFAREAYRALFL